MKNMKNIIILMNPINFIVMKKCHDEYSIIINKKKCIDKCKNDDKYKYEYNNTYYEKCLNGTIMNDKNFICYNNKANSSEIINVNSVTSMISIINLTIYIEPVKDERDEEIRKFREKNILF